MTGYVSRALQNVTCMAPGREAWSRYQNDLWHWFKHARGHVFGGVRVPPEIPGLPSEDRYLELAAEICRRAASGEPGTEVKIRERDALDGLAAIQFLVWFEPPGTRRGLFLVVNDRGDHGGLATMFPPIEGRACFDGQVGEWPC
jgi:hypothetical protein